MIKRNARDKRKTYVTPKTIRIDHYIGDSNCSGAGANTTLLPEQYTGVKPVQIYFKAARGFVDDGAWQEFEVGVNNNRTTELSSNQHGLEVALAYKFSQNSPDKRGIIKWGLGGSAIYPSGSIDDWRKTSSELYNEFVNYVAIPAYQKKYNEGYTPILNSFIISLGTNDAITALGGQGDNFYTNLTQLCNDLKSDLNAAMCTIMGDPLGEYLTNTKFIIILSPPNAPNRPYLSDTRDAEKNFITGRATGTVLTAYTNAYLANADFIKRNSDLTHFNSTGFILLADVVYPLIK